jgi:hypothetical protein
MGIDALVRAIASVRRSCFWLSQDSAQSSSAMRACNLQRYAARLLFLESMSIDELMN